VRRLNLASRPFRNERLPNVLAVTALLAVLAVSAWHLFIARDVLPDRTSSLIQTLTEREAESGRLRAEEASLRALRPEGSAVAEWKLVKDLVDQRMFSWSTLFSVLEETLPDGVRLQALDPQVEAGSMSLKMQAYARTHEEAMDLMVRMEERPEFEGVQPASRSTMDDGSILLVCNVKRYLPPPAAPAAPPAPPSPAAAAAPAEEPPVPSTQARR
jgi:Tfp pilus assembly protein PilN